MEEMKQCIIPRGYVFYFGSAHREEVLFTETLRRHTEETVRLAFELIARGELPAPLEGKQAKQGQLPSMHPKCKDCSLEPLCLPREVLALEKMGGGARKRSGDL